LEKNTATAQGTQAGIRWAAKERLLSVRAMVAQSRRLAKQTRLNANEGGMIVPGDVSCLPRFACSGLICLHLYSRIHAFARAVPAHNP
jgi:hypothetical protein